MVTIDEWTMIGSGEGGDKFKAIVDVCALHSDSECSSTDDCDALGLRGRTKEAVALGDFS